MGDAAQDLRRFALGLPGAREDFPWGERVAKVADKVFAFMGKATGATSGVSLSVKLPRSATRALDRPFCEPTGYGLGRSGWVTVKLDANAQVPIDLLCGWIEESYRSVAPKKMIAKLDARPPAPRHASTARATKVATPVKGALAPSAPGAKPAKAAAPIAKVAAKGGVKLAVKPAAKAPARLAKPAPPAKKPSRKPSRAR